MLNVDSFTPAGLPMRKRRNKNTAPTESDREDEKMGNSAFIDNFQNHDSLARGMCLS